VRQLNGAAAAAAAAAAVTKRMYVFCFLLPMGTKSNDRATPLLVRMGKVQMGGWHLKLIRCCKQKWDISLKSQPPKTVL
jgi:hypothetical protein